MTRQPSIAVYGGSFDPPHLGHLLVGATVLGAYEVDQLYVLPTFEHYLKPSTTASFDDRFEMASILFRELERAHVLRLEQELGGPSLTLRTLEELQRREPSVAFRLVLGTDLRHETARWHRFDRICELAPPLWIGREGYGSAEGEILIPNVSSTDLRRRLRAGVSTLGWLHPGVMAYVQSRNLYRGGRA